MSRISTDELRAFLLAQYGRALKTRGKDPQDIPDDFDLLTEGIIDSLGIMEMITAIEANFGLEIDFEDLDAEDLTRIGPLCRYIEKKSAENIRP
jgi:acyl carrier protein